MDSKFDKNLIKKSILEEVTLQNKNFLDGYKYWKFYCIQTKFLSIMKEGFIS